VFVVHGGALERVQYLFSYPSSVGVAQISWWFMGPTRCSATPSTLRHRGLEYKCTGFPDFRTTAAGHFQCLLSYSTPKIGHITLK